MLLWFKDSTGLHFESAVRKKETVKCANARDLWQEKKFWQPG
jgi:hypothetical protein